MRDSRPLPIRDRFLVAAGFVDTPLSASLLGDDLDAQFMGGIVLVGEHKAFQPTASPVHVSSPMPALPLITTTESAGRRRSS